MEGTSGDLGTFASNNYYPTPYSDQQLFFGVTTGGGMRSNSVWGSGGYTTNVAGTLV